MVKTVCMIRIPSEGMELKLTFLAWKELPRPTLGLHSLTGCCFALSLWWNIKAVIFQTCFLESPVQKTVPLEGLDHFWETAFPSDQSDSHTMFKRYIYFFYLFWPVRWQSNEIKVTKIMLPLRDNGSVLCSANQAYYQWRNLQPSFFFFFLFWRVVGKRVSRCWESVRGSDMQVTRMVSTLYITIRLPVSLEAWSGGGSGRQSFVSLVAPFF